MSGLSSDQGPSGDKLPVPIYVDPETGVWSVDGLPMILIPRHYWAQMMQEVEAGLGLEEAAKLYFSGTYKAAYFWCEKEAETHGLSGVDVFTHYMTRMSQRGHGRITVEEIEPAEGAARLRIENSAIALAYGFGVGRNVCHFFNGAFCGGMEFAAADTGRSMKVESSELQCLANGAGHCVFQISRSP